MATKTTTKKPKKSMDDLFAEYLLTLSDAEAERRYWSLRKYAKVVFEDFRNWLAGHNEQIDG